MVSKASFDASAHGYTIIKALGTNPEGGRTTYLAEDRAGRRAVLKRFAFAAVDASWSGYREHEREIAVLRELSHPRVPRYLDAFETADGFCLVQEYLDVPPLSARSSFEPEEVKAIALSILDILAALQRRLPPVIHRDLKPENILVNNHNEAYLVDFGLARPKTVTASTLAVGTPGFMAPEQLFGRELGLSTDLFGLGATLISMLTATPSAKVGELIDNSMRFDLSRLPAGLDPSFRRWLEAMVAPDPGDRHASATAARDALVGIEVVAPPSRTTSPSPRPSRTPSRPASRRAARWKQWSLIAVTALVPVIAFVAVLQPDLWSNPFGPPAMKAFNPPLLVDVDGDGNDDLVYLSGLRENVKLVAITTPEHDVLWKHKVSDGRLFLADATIGHYAERELSAHDLDDGELRWTLTLPDEVDEVYGDARSLWVECTDETHLMINLQSGQRSSAPPEPPAGMTMLVAGWPNRDGDWEESSYELSRNWPNLFLDQPFCRASDRDYERRSCRSGKGTGFATKSPGTPTPFIVGFDRPSGELRWKFQLFEPGEHDYLSSHELQVGLDETHVYVLARSGMMGDYEFDMWALAIEDGELAWHVQDSCKDEIEALVVAKERLYLLSRRRQALVLDKSNGESVRF